MRAWPPVVETFYTANPSAPGPPLNLHLWKQDWYEGVQPQSRHGDSLPILHGRVTRHTFDKEWHGFVEPDDVITEDDNCSNDVSFEAEDSDNDIDFETNNVTESRNDTTTLQKDTMTPRCHDITTL